MPLCNVLKYPTVSKFSPHDEYLTKDSCKVAATCIQETISDKQLTRQDETSNSQDKPCPKLGTDKFSTAHHFAAQSPLRANTRKAETFYPVSRRAATTRRHSALSESLVV